MQLVNKLRESEIPMYSNFIKYAQMTLATLTITYLFSVDLM